jgi:DNA-binding response OmpR family regulator
MSTATVTTGARPPQRPLLRAVPAGEQGTDFASRLADAGLSSEGPLQYGDLVVDLPAYVVSQRGDVLDLSARQIELLALFLLAPRRVWSRDQLHWLVWGDTARSRRVDVQLCRLRSRTGLDPFRNVRDRGWALRPLT